MRPEKKDNKDFFFHLRNMKDSLKITFENSETLRKQKTRALGAKPVSALVRHTNVSLDSYHRPPVLTAGEWLNRAKGQLLLFQEVDPKNGARKPEKQVTSIDEIRDIADPERIITAFHTYPLTRDGIAYYLDGLLHQDKSRMAKIERGQTTWTDDSGNVSAGARYIRIRDTMRGFNQACGLNEAMEYERKTLRRELEKLTETPPVLPVYRYEKGRLKVQMEPAMKIAFWEAPGDDGHYRSGIELELPEPLYEAMIVPKPIGSLGYIRLHFHLNVEIRQALKSMGAPYHTCFDRFITYLEKGRSPVLRGDFVVLKNSVFASDGDRTPMYPSRVKKLLETTQSLTRILRARGIIGWELSGFQFTKAGYRLEITPETALQPIAEEA
jgi:hypothetical protein